MRLRRLLRLAEDANRATKVPRVSAGLRYLTVAALAAISLTAADKKTAPIAGVKTPGVLIPSNLLKSEATIELASPPAGVHFGDAITVADSTALRRFDPKTNQAFDPTRDVKEVTKACGGLVNAFSNLWIATCDKPQLAKIELPATRGGRRGVDGAKPGRGPRPEGAKPDAAKPDAPKPDAEAAKTEAAAKPEPPKPAAPQVTPPKPDFAKPTKPPVLTALDSAPAAPTALAASEDSLWLLADNKTTLQRIDPDNSNVVAEIRLPTACTAILYAESALWVACPTVAKLLRIEPKTNLVDKRIDVAAEPIALAAGESSIWVFGRKEGKISRVDAKTNKVTATIETGLTNITGALAFGEGSLWASAPGYPVMRIAPATADKPGTDKVVQQFHGEGGGWIAFGAGSVWVGSDKSSKLVRYDPKRIAATLAE